jgi:hypothetical protein
MTNKVYLPKVLFLGLFSCCVALAEEADQSGSETVNQTGCSAAVVAPPIVCADRPYEVVVTITADEADADDSLTVSLTGGSVITAVDGMEVAETASIEQPCPSEKTYTVDPKGNAENSVVRLNDRNAATTRRYLIERIEFRSTDSEGKSQILAKSRLSLRVRLDPSPPEFPVIWSHDRGGVFLGITRGVLSLFIQPPLFLRRRQMIRCLWRMGHAPTIKR